jgi:hypothetical protein
VALEVAVTLSDIVPLSEPAFEGLAPNDNEPVGVCDVERERLWVEVGVHDEVAVPLRVALAVGVLVAVDELVVLPEFELLAGVFVGLAPIVIDDDDENEIDALRVMVDDAVSDGVDVPEIVALAVGVTDGVFKALIVEDGVIGGEIVALNDIEDVPLAESQKLRVLVGDVVIVDDTLATIELESLLVLVPVRVELGVLEPVPDDELVGLFDGEVDGVSVADSDDVGEIVMLNDKEGVPLAEPP